MARPTLTRHRKFKHLSRLLGSKPLALGSLELLWEVAYENGDDLLGKAEDVEYQAGWQGAPGALVSALMESEFLDQDGNLYRVHDLWDHAPDYVRKRLKREQQRRETGAKLRTLSGQRPDTDRSVSTPPAPAPGIKVKVKNTVAPAGATVPVSPEKRKPKPLKPEIVLLAEKIVAHYEAQIREHRPSRYRAREHIVSILKSGVVSAPVLWECVNEYEPEASRVEVQFRKVAGNFFGRDAVYKAYLDAAKAEVTRYDAQKARRNVGSDAGGAGEIEAPADARGVGS